MQDWEKTLEKFLKKWKNKKEIEGAIIAGSYITGNPSKHSDLDIHLISNKNVKWRERGNEIIDGIMIEYCINPMKKHYEYMEEDKKSRKKLNAHIFSTGKILFDKTGELTKLVKESKKELKKKYSKINKTEKEILKYRLWDLRDNLEEIYESGGEEFYYVYFQLMKEIMEIYTKEKQFHSIPPHKIKKFLIDKKEQKKYLIGEFPDKKFVNMYIDALKIEEKNKMLKKIQKLIEYVLNKMGGLKVNGWKIRTPLN